MIDILFVYPPEGDSNFPPMVPLGLCWIAAVLEENGYSVRVVDLTTENAKIEKIVHDERPKIVGIGGTTVTRFQSFKLASLVKKTDPQILTIYGGPHATFTAEDTLSHIKDIDIVVRGEGEYTVLDLANRVNTKEQDYTGVLGISYRRNGVICHNSPRPRIRNLDSLPLPARHLLNMNAYLMDMPYLPNTPGISVMSSRGCPIACVFCSASAMWGNLYTSRSPSRVLDEIQMLVDKYHAQAIKFFDSTLTLHRGHIQGICDEFLKRGLSIPWECEVRASSLDFELLKKMKEAGCYYIDLGIESVSPRVLKIINKKITVEQIENVINWASELGLRTKGFFMMGLPGETLEDALMTVEFMKKYKDKMSPLPGAAPTRIYPGTFVEQFAKERGYLPEGFSWSEPLEKYPQFRQQFSWRATDPVPFLIQPQFGYRELGRIAVEVDKMQGFLSPRGVFSSLLAIRSLEDVKRKWDYIHSRLRWAWWGTKFLRDPL